MTEIKSKAVKKSATSTTKKSTASKSASKKSTSPRKPALKSVTASEMQSMIAQNAYYRAERRGFAAGDHMQDWLAAEAEISQTFKVKVAKTK